MTNPVPCLRAERREGKMNKRLDQTASSSAGASFITREPFGTMADGRLVEHVRLHGAGGFEVCIISYGAGIQALYMPDRHGRLADIVLGHDALEPYVAHRHYFGATVGRYANRIAGGAFTLDGVRYQLSLNDRQNSLHGGIEGFDRKLWTVESIGAEPAPFVTLSYVSADGDQGYPGQLTATVNYSLSAEQELTISFSATATQATIVNLTNHSFFNLAGVEKGGDILGHILTIVAEAYLPVNAAIIPLGSPGDVAGTPFDFRNPQRIGERIGDACDQLALGRGYDHNFCLSAGRVPQPRFAARVEHEASGRAMELFTDQPGVQFYSGNFLDGTVRGKYGRLYRQSEAFCLEPQNWPDAPNRPDFPSARIDPGQGYSHTSIYRFRTTAT
jgi:aldose 1-epimerase